MVAGADYHYAFIAGGANLLYPVLGSRAVYLYLVLTSPGLVTGYMGGRYEKNSHRAYCNSFIFCFLSTK